MAPQHHHHPGMMMMDPNMQGQLGPSPGMPPQYVQGSQQQQQPPPPWSMNTPSGQFQQNMMSPQGQMHPHMAHMRMPPQQQPSGTPTPGSNMMMPPPAPAPTANNPSARLPPQPPMPSLPAAPTFQIPLPMQPEYRIFEMNKRLTSRPEFQPFNAGPLDPDQLLAWYEAFANDFFADEIPGLPTRLTLRNMVDDQTGLPRSYTVNRAQLPKFFKTFAEGNCSDLFFQVNHGGRVTLSHRYLANMNGGSDPQQVVIFETESCTMSSQLGKPMFIKACVEGSLNVEFVQRLVAVPSPSGSSGSPAPGTSPTQFSFMATEPLKIRNWIFTVKRHSELIPRACIAVQQDLLALEPLSKNVTRSGLTSKTLNFLKILNVCEPMQELMARHKGTGMPPRDCLRQAVIHRANNNHMRPANMMPPPSHHPPTGHAHMPMQHHPMMQPGQFQRSNSQQMLAGGGPPSSALLEDLNSPIKSEKSSANSSPNQQSPGASTPGSKRRKRKSSTGDKKQSGGVSASKNKKSATTPQPTPPSTPNLLQNQSPHPIMYPSYMSGPASGDVMTVGEPSLMGGDFGEEDERLITRLENNQFDTMLSMTREPMQMNSNLIKQQPQSPLNNITGRPSRPPSSLILPPPPPPPPSTRPLSGYNTSSPGQQSSSIDPNSLINNPTIHQHHMNKIPTPPFQQPVLMPNNILDDDLNGLESTIVSSNVDNGAPGNSTTSSSSMNDFTGSGGGGSDLFPVTRPNSTSPTNNSNLINGIVQPSTSSSAIASSSSSSSSPTDAPTIPSASPATAVANQSPNNEIHIESGAGGSPNAVINPASNKSVSNTEQQQQQLYMPNF